ncbi:hypothetical protein HPP92_004225 [Vanilla planifolia]|uniref:Uncharacterized protein n=1 Tax=Vanilla planifolia TaxID=51239 RepID=A0A835RWH5_VANPL|nr:hypothetical protein HPP92_004225 [Vanilla planifolia]
MLQERTVTEIGAIRETGGPSYPSPPPPGGGETMADSIPPPTFRHRPLLKHLSWSPDMEREEAWERRKDLYRARRFSGRQSVRSVTEDDLDELRGCIDLGIVFGDESAERIGEILPALDLYLSVRRGFYSVTSGRSSASDTSSFKGSPAGNPLSIFSSGNTPSEVKAGLKRWAQVVACAVRDPY